MFDGERRESLFMILGIVVVLVVCAVYYFVGGKETTGDPQQVAMPSGPGGPDQSGPPVTGNTDLPGVPKRTVADADLGSKKGDATASILHSHPTPESKKRVAIVPPEFLNGQ